jgi:hypothetical protein
VRGQLRWVADVLVHVEPASAASPPARPIQAPSS